MKISNTAERLKELLEIFNIKQSDIVEKTGIPKSAISMYLKGTRVPRQDRLSGIADAFNVDEAWLMGYDVEMHRKTAEEKFVDYAKEFNDAHPELPPPQLNTRDERDIKKDLDSIMKKLTKNEYGPAAYNGEDLSPEAADLFRDELEIALKRLKLINKEKYSSRKNQK